jgi:hypothetical protein
MSSPIRCGIVVGAVLLVIHSALALCLFLSIHFNRGAQAEMAWMYFDFIDFGVDAVVWKHVASTAPFVALFDWGYEWGSGPNLRAFVIYALFGGIEWFLIGFLVGFLFWPKRGYIAHWRSTAV